MQKYQTEKSDHGISKKKLKGSKSLVQKLQEISIDFITDLPNNKGINSILAVRGKANHLPDLIN